MKSKSLIAALLAALSLTSCDLLGGKDDGKKEEEQKQDDPVVDTEKTVLSGASVELDGNFSLSAGEKADVVALVYNASTSKTKVLGLKGGTVKVSNGTKSININVKYNITGAVVGKDFGARNALALSYLRVNNTEAQIEDFKAGNKNPFFMDVDLQYASYVLEGNEWVADDNFINLTQCGNFFEEGKKPRIEVAGQDYLTMNDDLSVSFKEAAKDQKIELSFIYKLNGSDKTVKEYVTVKEGYNAHDDNELRKYFEDVAISGDVYLARSIKATLPEDRYIKYTDSNGVQHRIPSNTQEMGIHKGSPFFRNSDAATVPEVVVNGNYYEVSAEGIEDHVPLDFTEQSTYGISPTQGQPISDGTIANPFEGVFYVHTPNAGTETAKLTNMKITSNGNRALPGQDQPSSGANSLVGVFFNRSIVGMDNIKVNRGYAGVYAVGGTSVANVSYSECFDNWGPGIHSFRGYRINVEHSYFHENGGPAVWVLNNSALDEYSTRITVDNNTKIENYVSPSGSWLLANNVTVDPLIQAINPILKNGNLTMLKDDSLINFEILVQNDTDPGSNNHLYKNITLDGCSNSEQPQRFAGDYLSTPVGGIFSASGAYFTSLGMTDETINNKCMTAIYEYAAAHGGVITPEEQAQVVQGVWATDVFTDMGTRIAQGQRAHLDLTTAITAVGIGTYEISAVIGILPLAK